MRPQEAVERVLKLSKADACVSIGTESTTANVRWANNSSTTNGFADSANLVVISVIGKSVGMVSRNYFPEDRLESIVRESEAAAEGKPEAQDYAPLIEPQPVATDWVLPHQPTDPAILGEFVADLSKAFKKAGDDGIKLFGYAHHSGSTVWLGTSTGVRLRGSNVDGSVEFTAKTPDFALSTWAEKLTKTFDDVDVDSSYSRFLQRLEWSRKSVALDPGDYEVILEPAAVAEMLVHLYLSSTARSADEGWSPFSKAGGGTLVGEKLYSETVNLYSDPAEPGLELPPFVTAGTSTNYSSIFDNAMPVTKVDWVKDGVLQALITPRHWAAKTGVSPRPFIGNLILAGTERSLEDMIASTDRALLVTRFWYIRTVDPKTLLLTGLTRDGVFLVENGRVKSAVNNFRFNMSPIQMLASASEVGKAERALSFAKVPPLRVERFHMSSVSEAT